MGDSPKHPNLPDKDRAPKAQRPCDYCGDSTGILYCRADSAKLCFSCDREVHSTNQLFSKHTRALLCDACNDSPATILCSTESSVFCQNCDWERHNLSLSLVHDRRPLEGFTGCPSVSELLSILGFEDLGKKALFSTEDSGVCDVGSGDGFVGSELEEGLSDLFVWDAPAVVSLDDLISSTSSSHNYQAMEVPPLPKNRKAACGQHKEEIISQLRELAKSEPIPEQYLKSASLSTGFEHEFEADIFPSYERIIHMQTNVLEGHRDSETANQVVPPNTSLYKEEALDFHSVSTVCGNHTYLSSGGQLNSFNSENSSTTPKVASYELTSQERDSALLRYKEKKRTRRYDRHIRYESRKVRAESRTRIKGRFAKIEH
ncbi:zinc finger protein CONSTANS-LIKE 13-like [Neltuma alba]|uniref:zinc finger protein CONSTANS-LIKE 13-like n=1 Tax=Neltuma alba TaxID=207710 RepID=UPI0010A2C2B8|nr:zinc finger protein CONSTANS-LIKE 13-like [Prosopis alba]